MVSKHTFQTKSKYIALAIVVGLIVFSIILGFALKNSQMRKAPPVNKDKKTSEQVKLKGKMACLPRIPNTDGSVTSDCIYGFLADGGNYYLIYDPSNGNTNTWFESPLYSAEKLEIQGVLTNEKSNEFEVAGKITLEAFTVLDNSATDEPEYE